ncbi:MAG: TIGR02281 family clan AA aspartic protease [Sulfuriferula sp.]|nr:TIGR02281 family clan AA aspartic protease [Sulfuriferula sp.]
MNPCRAQKFALTFALFASVNLSYATNINVTGLFTDRAMVMIDGGKPRVMTVGETINGAKLISANASNATFQVDGKKRVLSMGESYTGGGNNSSKATASLNADASGHFFTTGSINGNSVNFVVDTGATLVTISTQDADHLGIDYRHGTRGTISTANGSTNAYGVTFNNIRIGGISLNMVQGVVVEGGGLPIALLGMSFLNQTNMQRDGSTMTLTQRY